MASHPRKLMSSRGSSPFTSPSWAPCYLSLHRLLSNILSWKEVFKPWHSEKQEIWWPCWHLWSTKNCTSQINYFRAIKATYLLPLSSYSLAGFQPIPLLLTNYHLSEDFLAGFFGFVWGGFVLFKKIFSTHSFEIIFR